MKKPNMIAIEIMAGKSGPEKDSSYKKSKSDYVEEDTDEEEDEDENETDWGCPKCGTTCCATMTKESLSCPCCGADMEEIED